MIEPTLVAPEVAATTGEDGRMAFETWPLLLAFAGGEPSDEAAVREYEWRIAPLPPPAGWPKAWGNKSDRAGAVSESVG